MPLVDLSEIPDNDEGYKPVPDGKYPVTVIDAVDSKSQKSGNDMIKLTLEIESGKYDKRFIFDTITFAEGKAMSRVKLVVSRLGIAKDFKGMITGEMLVGRRAIVDVYTETYEGKARNKVQFAGYEAVGQSRPQEPDKDDDFMF